MAKPANTPTPIIRGADAAKIAREIRDGTPWTEQRAELFRRADAIFRKVFGSMNRPGTRQAPDA